MTQLIRSRESHRSGLLWLVTGLVVAVLGVMAAQADAGTTTYKYDALGRVIEVNYPDGSKITYTYDAAGNRTQTTRQAGS